MDYDRSTPRLWRRPHSHFELGGVYTQPVSIINFYPTKIFQGPLMTLLLNCDLLSKSFGSKELFSQVSLGISRGDKIGLIGPNGAGKSTLLKILAGIEKADKGTVSSKKSLRIGYVPQSSSYPDTPIEEVLLQAASFDSNLQDYEKETEVSILLSKLGFKDTTQLASTLSGGWKKRLDIAKELIKSPDVLFLDEPTNHLDIEGIVWLESFLKNESTAFIVTSHDRYFLDNIALKIIELNTLYPQGIFSSNGNYTDFVEKREDFFNQQLQSERALASKVRYEVDWLRKSPKARTTKSQARIQSAGQLIDELSDVKARNKIVKTKIDFESTDRQTKKLLTCKNISKTLGDKLLFSKLDLNLSPGMRLGIIGPNGCGKTTLLKLIGNEILPDTGTLKYAEGLRIVYFDQHRQALNLNDTLRQALSPNSDTVIYRGQSIHVNSWGKRFLFNADRMDLPVRQLSGGEKARIGIARLMLKPADLLLLDEPTNDLDIPTLETLEESLMEFSGAIVLITHDRALLDRLTTNVIGLGIDGEIPLLADYRQLEAYIEKNKKSPPQKEIKNTSISFSEPTIKAATPQKNPFRKKKELEKTEAAIHLIEEEIGALNKQMEIHSHQNNLIALQKTCESLDVAQKKLDTLFHLWQELEANNIDK